MEYVILSVIGLVMGLFGGLLGIGGSAVMIPAMVIAFGENQHLYQASAMICNFFVAAASIIAHRKAQAMVPEVLKWLIPAAAASIIAGVALSNASVFAGEKSYLLARLFGAFLIYVIASNAFKMYRQMGTKQTKTADQLQRSLKLSPRISLMTGLMTGTGAGLLGIGAGTIATPLQQLFMKMPLKRAMSNSAATIMGVALIGASYKTITLPRHGIAMIEPLKIAAIVIPTAIIGGFVGGHLMHLLPKQLVRAVFIIVLVAAAFRLLTVT